MIIRKLARWWRGPAVADRCRCENPPPFLIVDVNGWRRWCGECGGRLWA